MEFKIPNPPKPNPTSVTYTYNSNLINLSDNNNNFFTYSNETINIGKNSNIRIDGNNNIINMSKNNTLTLCGVNNTVNHFNDNFLWLATNSSANISSDRTYIPSDPNALLANHFVMLSYNDKLGIGLGNFNIGSYGTGNVLDFSAIKDNMTIKTQYDGKVYHDTVTYTDNGITYTDTFTASDNASIINATLGVSAGTTQTVSDQSYSTFNLGADTNLTVSPHTLTDTFNLAQNFDKVSITGFGVNDIMSLNHNDFANWATLLQDASASANGHDTVIRNQSNGETITLAMDLTRFKGMDGSHFHFV